jgi:hypothetical protein
MSDRKTLPSDVSVDSYLAAIERPSRRADCEALAALMARVSTQTAVMWGPSIVGFGIRRYPLAGGKQGEICAIGFSSRKGDISIYAMSGTASDEAFLSKLGKHKRGKGCLYISRLADVDLQALEGLVAFAYAAGQGGAR